MDEDILISSLSQEDLDALFKAMEEISEEEDKNGK